MPENLTRLRRPVEPIHFPEQVALLRAALERMGYTASDQDSQAANVAFSEGGYNDACRWSPIYDSNAEHRARWLVEHRYLEPAE